MIKKELSNLKLRELTLISKIYILKDPRTDAVRYVGKTVKKDINKRLLEHCSYKNKTHKYFWISQLKSLGLKPIIEVIEICNYFDWQQREIFWIEHYKNAGCKLTNSHRGGTGGHDPSEETRAKMSAAAKGRKASEETKLKMRKPKSEEHKLKLIVANTGRVLSEESKEKIRQSLKGKQASEEAKLHMSLAQKGRKHSEETKLKISSALKGEKNPSYGRLVSEETKKRISQSSSTRKHTEETKEKIRQINKGRHFSEETRAKMRESSRLRWDRASKNKVGDE